MFPINVFSMFLEDVFVLVRLMFPGQRILGKSVCVCVCTAKMLSALSTETPLVRCYIQIKQTRYDM